MGVGLGVGVFVDVGVGRGAGVGVCVGKAETWSRMASKAAPRLIQAGLQKTTSYMRGASRGSCFAWRGTAYMRGAVRGGLKGRRALRAALSC